MESTHVSSINAEETSEDDLSISRDLSENEENIDHNVKNVIEGIKEETIKKHQMKFRYCLVCERRCPSYYVQIFTTIPAKRAQWISLLSLKCAGIEEKLRLKLEELNAKNTYICYDHFDNSQFTKRCFSRPVMLSRYATPDPYVEKDFIVNRHDVKPPNFPEIPSLTQVKVKKEKLPRPSKVSLYKAHLFKEILSIPTEHLSSTEWVKLQINLELLRKIRKKSEIHSVFSTTQFLSSVSSDVPC